MKNVRNHSIIAAIVGALAVTGACADERKRFNSTPSFSSDAGDDGPNCGFQCSVDGRSIVRTCNGELVEMCPQELACGAARCQEPCAAAAADRRSDGCEFYFEAPRYQKSNHMQSCFAVYIVNTSLQGADLSLELESNSLDFSRSLYRTNPGDATLIPHQGRLPPGESAILFVSDLAKGPSAPPGSGGVSMGAVPCPKGIVPASYADRLPDGTGIGSAFHLKSNVPVAVTSIYPFGGARSFLPSATLLLPVAIWSKQHIMINGWETTHSGVPSAQIVASENDTNITILPKYDIQDGDGVVGARAGTPAHYRLGRGQILQISQSQELSGSIVTSTKPTTIFGGHSCADVPTTGGTCDFLSQQIPAFDYWGSEYVGVGYRPRTGNEHELVGYRIVAARDGTRLDYDPELPPGAPVTMSAGEVVMFARGTGDPFVVRTQDVDHPIYMAAYMSGQRQGFDGPSGGSTAFAGRGDPDFVNVVPSGQYLNSYSFYADPTYDDTSLVIVRAKINGEFKDVWLDCAGNLRDFKPIGARRVYEYTRVDLQRDRGPGDRFNVGVCQTGLQRMRSDGPFTATVWGWATAASYAYTGGMAQRKLVITPLAPIQ